MKFERLEISTQIVEGHYIVSKKVWHGIYPAEDNTPVAWPLGHESLMRERGAKATAYKNIHLPRG